MSIRASIAHAALVFVSLSALAAEWLPQSAPGPMVRPALPAAAPAVFAMHAPGDHLAQAGLVLARPLFSPARRQADFGKANTPRAAAAPRLEGILVAPARKRAIFEAHGKRVMVLAENDSIEGWLVVDIEADQVSLRGHDTVMTLSPQFLLASLGSRTPDQNSRWTAPAAHGLLHMRWANPQLQP